MSHAPSGIAENSGARFVMELNRYISRPAGSNPNRREEIRAGSHAGVKKCRKFVKYGETFSSLAVMLCNKNRHKKIVRPKS
jgi:hypothetical protein